MTEQQKYSATIYIAAPGTPLANERDPAATSLPGHMFFTISDGHDSKSFGFAPVEHGSINGPGRVVRDDSDNYRNPLYSRTLEITKDQYDKLRAFGESPEKFGFDTHYRDVRNNCVDFSWAALNHAGLKRTEQIESRSVEVDGKSAYRPVQNVDSVRSIQPPMPGSPLNQEHLNPMPRRSVMQHLLTEENHPVRLDDAAHPDHALYLQARNGVHQLDASHGRIPDERSDNLAASLTVAARAQEMGRIDRVMLSDDAHRTLAMQGDLAALNMRFAQVATLEGLNTSVAQSSTEWKQVADRQQEAARSLTREPSMPQELPPKSQEPAMRA